MKTRISPYEMIVLLFFGVAPTAGMFVPPLIFKQAGRDSWISLLILIGFSILLAINHSILGEKMKRTDLVNYTKKVLSRPIAVPIIVAVIFMFVFFSGVITRESSETIKAVYYSQSSLWLLNLVMILTSGIIAYYGLEVMGRSAILMIYPYLFIFFILFLLTINEMSITRLQPIMAQGLKPILRGVIPGLTYFSELFLVLIIAPHLTQRGKIFKSTLIVILIISVFMLISVITPIAIFGEEFSTKMEFPIITSFSYIERYTIIERMDPFFVFFWVAGSIGKAAIYIYAGAYVTQKLFNITSYYVFIPFYVVLAYLSANYFPSIYDLKDFLSSGVIYFLVILVLYPCLLNLVSLFRGESRS